MKGILFFLSVLFFLSCESNHDDKKPKSFDIVQNIDSVFSLAHEWSGKTPPISEELLDSLDFHLDSIKIYHFNNSIEPKTIIFSAQKKSQLEILEQTSTLKNLNKVSYESYTVWRSVIENKEILEFSLQPHPTLYWTFTIRRRGQE
jgi:hypothetical protein